MEELGTWFERERLAPGDVVGWLVRLAKGLAAMHELNEPHGRLAANAVMAVGPRCGAPAVLVMPDEVDRDVRYYSAERAKLSGASLPDDVWALGVILYLGLTDAFPFPGGDRRAVRERIEWRPASPIEVYGLDHEPLQALLDRLFHSQPAQRLTTLGPLIAALEAIEPQAAKFAALELDDPTEVAVAAAKPVERQPAPAPAAEAASEMRPESRPAPPEPDESARKPARPAPPTLFLAPWVIVALVVVAVVAMTLVWWPHLRLTEPQPVATAEPAAASATGSSVPPAVASRSKPASARSAATGPAAASTSVVAPPSAPLPSASVAPAAVPAKPRDRRECVSQLFSPETFAAGRPNFRFVCNEPDPRKGADALGTEVVLGKGRRAVTPAMREWDKLGWFQMAMFAVVRATCCETATPLESSLGAGACNFDGALMALGEAVAHGGEGDGAAAVDRYLTAIQCLVNAHYAHAFGEKGGATQRQRQAFDVVTERVRTKLSR